MLTALAWAALVIGSLIITLWLSTRNPGRDRELRDVKRQLAAYQKLTADLKRRAAEYADTDPVAATLLDVINSGTEKEVTR